MGRAPFHTDGATRSQPIYFAGEPTSAYLARRIRKWSRRDTKTRGTYHPWVFHAPCFFPAAKLTFFEFLPMQRQVAISELPRFFRRPRCIQATGIELFTEIRFDPPPTSLHFQPFAIPYENNSPSISRVFSKHRKTRRGLTRLARSFRSSFAKLARSWPLRGEIFFFLCFSIKDRSISRIEL